jgi:hypothetical protein
MENKLDITDITPREKVKPIGQPFLQVEFACCNTYQRIYRSRDGASYQGRCPRCGKPVKFSIGDCGTSARAFIVY